MVSSNFVNPYLIGLFVVFTFTFLSYFGFLVHGFTFLFIFYFKILSTLFLLYVGGYRFEKESDSSKDVVYITY